MIGSKISRNASIIDSKTDWPLPGKIDAFPITNTIRKIIKADVTQPVAMLLVITQPWPKSTNLAAEGATPSPSAAKEIVATERAAQKLRNFLTLSMICQWASHRGKELVR